MQKKNNIKQGNSNFFDLIKNIYSKINRDQIDKFNRSLPFQDSIFDRFERAKALNFGENTSIYNSAYVFGDVRVGNNTWIGPNTMLDGSGGSLEIGNFCSISSGVQIYTHETVMWAISGGVSPYKKKQVKIGSCNYIGTLSIINLGVTIGDHCVIAANSFINCDIPDRCIFAGTPAKKIGEVVGEKDNMILQYKTTKD